MEDTKIRSIVKAVTWRVIATITTMVLVFIYTREWTITLGVGVFDVLAKLLFYYSHERIWDRINFGRL